MAVGRMAPEHAKLAQAAFKSEQFYCVYGLTEAGPTGTLLLPHEHAEKAVHVVNARRLYGSPISR